MARRRRGENRVAINYVDIHTLEPYERNPRDNQQAVDSVANSIRTFGFLVPIIVDSDNIIVAGHTRLEAAKQLGLDDVPVIVADYLTPEQIKQFRLIDNKVSELARWDFDLLAGEISALQDSGLDFTQFGWTREELDCLTDVVAEDCLSSGAITELQATDHQRRADRRAPSTTRFVIGEYVMFVPQEVYRQWANDLRVECDYDEIEIIRAIKARLGIMHMEDTYHRENP